MKLSQARLRQLIREELAKGIPEFALSNIAEKAASLCSEELLKVLIAHINQSAKDKSLRNKRYAEANRACKSMTKNKELLTAIEDKLKESLLMFLDERQ